MDQWLECRTSPYPEDEVPNIDGIIAVFTGNKKYVGNPDPSIKSWAQPVGALKDLLKNRYNLKGALVFCPYCLTNGMKEFSSGSKNKEWKD